MHVRQIAKGAPIGAASLTALATVAMCSLVFRLLSSSPATAFHGQWPVSFIIIAYLLFSPAVACALYSLVFERPKTFAVAGLVIGLVTVLVWRESIILLDGLALLPFWFLAAMGLVRFLRWRRGKIPTNNAERGF
jgi:hypothetical protein